MYMLGYCSNFLGLERKPFLFGLLIAVKKEKNSTKSIFRKRKSKVCHLQKPRAQNAKCSTIFENQYNINSPVRSAIRKWCADYVNRGTQGIRGGNWLSSIALSVRNQNQSIKPSLCVIATRTGVTTATCVELFAQKIKTFQFLIAYGLRFIWR